MTFETPLTICGPARSPRQMLAEQTYGGHASLHDEATAGTLGLAGAPIEGPTHFSQFDPLAVSVWGDRWFETGCISAHFQTMVVEGEDVTARLTLAGTNATSGRIDAHKSDGTPVLTGTVSVADPTRPRTDRSERAGSGPGGSGPGGSGPGGSGHGGSGHAESGPTGTAADPSELDSRLAGLREPGDLFIVDRLAVGRRCAPVTSMVDMDSPNGDGYPFSLRQKLDSITESCDYYSNGHGSDHASDHSSGASIGSSRDDNPWGSPVLPMEMVSVLSEKVGNDLPVRGPAIGLFMDLEVRLVHGPVLVGHEYVLEREVVALGQTRRTESYWVRTTITDPETDRVTATVLLHSGIFKESFAGYPADRL